MRFLVCTTDAQPCPASDQSWLSVAELIDPADLGITTDSLAHVYAWGFGSVLLAFLVGYALSVALNVLKKV